ncbi:unnamed protein product [Phaedon cochleariae]|uniref:Phorbol-ester/DAG-type domain-containing protein n=1 Tax=Phaedon cochleariae TaxID=80249 RepID=A0A9N9SGI5_PHACE|nr:unnamed protein product [Phaedon cochleariae]
MPNSTVASESSLKNKNCKKCKKTVVNGVKCNNCENYFHTSCAKNCGFVKSISNDLITCCEPSTQSVSNNECDNDQAFFDAIENLSPEKKVDISIFSYVIKQKDLIIDELRQKIKMLNDQIDLFKENGTAKRTNNADPTKTLEKLTYAKKTQQANVSLTEPTCSSGVASCAKISVITQNQVSCALMENETKEKCQSYINLTNPSDSNTAKHIVKDKSTSNNNSSARSKGLTIQEENVTDLNEDISPTNGQWKKVTHRNKKSRQLVVGTGTDGIAGSIKGVPKFVDLHVYRIDPSTDVTSMQNLLKPHFPEAPFSRA